MTMLLVSSKDNFIKEKNDFIKCTVCPVMKNIILPGSCTVYEVRIQLSIILNVDIDSIELYNKEIHGLVPVSDDSRGIVNYYVLLRIRGGKGGFRKQLEKKGRAYARTRRLRESNQSTLRTQKVKDTTKLQGKNVENGGKEMKKKESTVSVATQSITISDSNIRNAVRLGIKKTIEKLVDPNQ